MMKEERMNGPLTEYNKPFILQRADPYVYRHVDGSYYFTASVPEYDRIILRRADSLMGLKSAEEVTVWKCHESGPMSSISGHRSCISWRESGICILRQEEREDKWKDPSLCAGMRGG